jgi:hypothetical protein
MRIALRPRPKAANKPLRRCGSAVQSSQVVGPFADSEIVVSQKNPRGFSGAPAALALPRKQNKRTNHFER